MEPKEIKINNRIDVCWENINYRSIIQDTGKDFIAISIPSREGSLLPLRIGDSFTATYHHGNEAYGFNSRVLERRIEGNLPLLYIASPKEMKQVQRREYFRVRTIAALQYVALTEKTTLWEAKRILDERKGNKGLALDISAGGLKIKIKDQLKYGDRLLIGIHLSNNDYYIQGQVVRTEVDEKNDINYGICFRELERKTQEKLIQSIFEIERAQKDSIGRGYL